MTTEDFLKQHMAALEKWREAVRIPTENLQGDIDELIRRYSGSNPNLGEALPAMFIAAEQTGDMVDTLVTQYLVPPKLTQ